MWPKLATQQPATWVDNQHGTRWGPLSEQSCTVQPAPLPSSHELLLAERRRPVAPSLANLCCYHCSCSLPRLVLRNFRSLYDDAHLEAMVGVAAAMRNICDRGSGEENRTTGKRFVYFLFCASMAGLVASASTAGWVQLKARGCTPCWPAHASCAAATAAPLSIWLARPLFTTQPAPRCSPPPQPMTRAAARGRQTSWRQRAC